MKITWKKRTIFSSIMCDRSKFCKVFLNLNGMIKGNNFLLIPETSKQKLNVQYKSEAFSNYYEKIFTSEITTLQIKNNILSPLINTVLFDEQDGSIIHLSTQGIRNHEIDGFEYGFQNKLSILSMALTTIFQYTTSVNGDFLYIYVIRKVSISAFEIYKDSVHDLLLISKEEEEMYGESIKSCEVLTIGDAIQLLNESFAKKKAHL